MKPQRSDNLVNSSKSYEKVGRIYNAIRYQSNVDRIERLLQAEGDINFEIPKAHGIGPNLLFSLEAKDCSTLELLLNHGADFTKKNDEGRTVLHEVMKAEKSRWILATDTFKNDFVNAILWAHVKFNVSDNPSDENGISHFHVACMTNNAVAVEFFLENGVDVDLTVNASSPIFPLCTPLHLAVKYTNLDVVEVLMKHGANIHLKNADGLSPLHLLIETYIENVSSEKLPEHEKILNVFLSSAIKNLNNVNTIDDFGFCYFHVACLLQDQTLVENMLEKIENINQTVNSDSPLCAGYTALHFAAFSSIQIFKLLLKNGADIHIQNAKGQTAFDLCLLKYTSEDIQSIISSIPEWKNIVLSDNKTKLIDVVSIIENQYKFISFLNNTESAASLLVPLDSLLWPGYTLLHLAVTFTKKVGQYDRIDKIYNRINIECLRRGADVTFADSKGSTALHLAFNMRKHQVVDFLLNHHDKTVNPIDQNNLSHFHIACAARHLKAVEHFLSFGVDVNLKAIEHFLSFGVDVNSPILSAFKWPVLMYNVKYPYRHYFCPGSTALHISVANGHADITKKLLKHGADVNAKDANGCTPIHLLLSKKTLESSNKISDIILSAKNLKNITSPCGLSHLHVACFYRHSKAIKKLLKLGADINAPLTYKFDGSFKDFSLSEFDGYTPLHFSYREQADYKATFMLIKRGANVFAKDSKGISTLQNLLLSAGSKRDSDFPYKELYKSFFIQNYLAKELGITKLHLACMMNDPKLVKNLIDCGAKVNAKVYSNSPIWQGRTPLHCAVSRLAEKFNEKNLADRSKKIIRFLIAKGADPLMIDDNHRTPIHLMNLYVRESLTFLFSILFENTEHFTSNPTDTHGFSLFHIACMTENLAIIKKFFNHKVNVNQAISHFSPDNAGDTALHLLIKLHPLPEITSSLSDPNEENFLQIIDLLLNRGADVNASNAFSNTPFRQITGMERLNEIDSLKRLYRWQHRIPAPLRLVLMQKFISCGADIHATTVKGLTTFDLLLRHSNVTPEEIELFFNPSHHLNAYNSPIEEGNLAIIFCCQWAFDFWEGKPSEYQVSSEIKSNRKIAENKNAGRTAIHNVVAGHSCLSKDQNRFFAQYYANNGRDFYKELIGYFLIQGCDIDHEDVAGQTALHLAADVKNTEAIVALLEYGADINITDKDGKTAFGICCNSMASTRSHWYSERVLTETEDSPNYAIKYFATHIYKLEFCGFIVHQQNKELKDKVLDWLHPFAKRLLSPFHNEIERMKRIKIGTLFSLHEFLMDPYADAMYGGMTKEKRREVDQFFENISNCELCETSGLLKFKHRQTIERIKLIEPAQEAFNILTNYQLPDLCWQSILKYLKRADLKCLSDLVT